MSAIPLASATKKPRQRLRAALGSTRWLLMLAALACIAVPHGGVRAQAPSGTSGGASAGASGGTSGGTSGAVVNLTPGRPIAGRYIIVFQDHVASPGVAASELARLHGLQAGHVYSRAIKGFAAGVPASRLAALNRDPRIKSIEADQTVHAFAQTIPTGIQRILAPGSPALTINGVDDKRINADIAVIDTGIDAHPDLNLSPNRTDCTSGACVDGSARDGNGHGTHVAGTIGAIDKGSGVVGVAPGARLWGVRVLDNTGSGTMSAVIAGVDWVTAHAAQVKVANMSLGGGSSPALCAAISKAAAAGVTHVVAAGNAATDAANTSPANCPDAIAVSALADYDGRPGGLGSPTCANFGPDDTLATFSNYSRTVPLFAAPGVCILSTWLGGGYNTISGTSMATPHVTGAAALLAASGTIGPASIRAALNVTGSLSWNDTSGDGAKERLLDVSNATSYAPATLPGTASGATDTTPPTVRLQAPAVGTVSGATRVQIKADDAATATGGLNVTWRVDSKTPASATYNSATGLYEAIWDTTTASNASHLMTATATDAAGNTTTSAAVSVTVSNSAPATATTAGLKGLTVNCSVSGQSLYLSLTMVNNLGAPLTGATVAVSISNSRGGLWSGFGQAGANGTATFLIRSAPSGIYTTKITAMAAALPCPGTGCNRQIPARNSRRSVRPAQPVRT